jgi:methylated-DNA-[protein]-cysteine S-methyltransferase
MAVAYTLFDTAIGRCAMAWADASVVAVSLPAANDEGLVARIISRAPSAQNSEPVPFVAEAIAAIQRLLKGERSDLTHIPLDMEGIPAFHRRVYAFVRGIPPGSIMTYGDVAKRIGDPGAARAVGQAMAANCFPIIVPCHRVLAAGARPGGFSAGGGVDTKFKMLEMEGALRREGVLPFNDLPLILRPGP